MGDVVKYGDYEMEVEMNKEELKDFLEMLISALEDGKITYPFKEREIYVEFVEPIKVEVEYEGSSEKEKFEVKLKFRGKRLPEVPAFQ
jgi:amphi-Trp domain-containing protein